MAARPPILWLLGALVPVAVGLAWRLMPVPEPAGLADCGSLAPAPRPWRGAQAVAVLGSLALAARLLGADRGSLFLRWPSRRVVVASIAFPAVVAPLAPRLAPRLPRPPLW